MFDLVFAAVLLALMLTEVIAHLSRRRFQRAGDAFRCRLRTSGCTSAIWPRLTRRWSRRMWAMWVDDLLVVRRGPVLARTIPLRVEVSPTGVYAVRSGEVRRIGCQPIAIDLKVWDGSRIEMAAAEEARLTLVGPFLAAAVNALPPAPAPRRRI